ncbi:unknown [Roseburia sp. CAG:309]|nr:unknown [Roseburia sp. CAG:309]
MINFYNIKKFKVTKKGKVTAVKAGKAKVTVTEKSKIKSVKSGLLWLK